MNSIDSDDEYTTPTDAVPEAGTTEAPAWREIYEADDGSVYFDCGEGFSAEAVGKQEADFARSRAEWRAQAHRMKHDPTFARAVRIYRRTGRVPTIMARGAARQSRGSAPRYSGSRRTSSQSRSAGGGSSDPDSDEPARGGQHPELSEVAS